jgi:DNA polymerase III subunit beta
MKLTCQRDALLAACRLVAQAVPPRSIKPILTSVKAVAQDDGLTLMATDLEVGIRYELRGIDVTRAGAAVLPVQRLLAILQESSDAEVKIDADADATRITTRTGKYQLPGGDPDDFPDIPTFDAGGTYHEITAGVLKGMIRRVAFAADRKEGTARWAVTGVLWEAEGETARLVATDTKRLAMVTGPAAVHGGPPPGKDGKGPSHLIPQKAVQLLDRSLSDDGAGIRVGLKANDALFENGPVLIHTRLVEGRFPPYRDIIPKKSAVKLDLAAGEFLSRVRQAAVMTDDETKRVDFAFAAGAATLTARGAETGSGEVTLDLPDYAGPGVEIAFDPQYLVEFLRAIDGEPTISLEMTDGQRPAVFRVGDGYTYLVMPLAG